MGIGMIGAALGSAVIPGNPLSIFEIGIGGEILVSGLSLGALKAAVLAKQGLRLQAALDDCVFQGKQLPEAMLTSFCMGLMLGAIKSAIRKDLNNVPRDDESRRRYSSYIKSSGIAIVYFRERICKICQQFPLAFFVGESFRAGGVNFLTNQQESLYKI
jgi:hypothetical protein